MKLFKLSKGFLLNLILIQLGIINITYAQPEATNQNIASQKKSAYSIAPSLGGSSFTMTGTDNNNLSYHSGFLLGAEATYQSSWNERLKYISGLEYVQSGAKLTYVFVDTQEKALELDQTNHYLMIPAKVQFNVLQTEEASYFVRGGFNLAYLVKSTQESHIFGEKSESDVTNRMNRTDVLASFGLGAEKDIFSGKILMNLEFYKGLIQVQKDSKGYNQGFVAKIGYNISI